MLEFALKKERIKGFLIKLNLLLNILFKVQKLKGLEPGPEPTPPDAEDKPTDG